jgi:NAD-dependent deacetylase
VHPLPRPRRHGRGPRPRPRRRGRPVLRDLLGQARAIAAACDILLAVGTTLQVHPAAGLVDIALAGGARVIIVNADPTPYDDVAAEVLREPIGTSVPTLLRHLASEAGAKWPAD